MKCAIWFDGSPPSGTKGTGEGGITSAPRWSLRTKAIGGFSKTQGCGPSLFSHAIRSVTDSAPWTNERSWPTVTFASVGFRSGRDSGSFTDGTKLGMATSA